MKPSERNDSCAKAIGLVVTGQRRIHRDARCPQRLLSLGLPPTEKVTKERCIRSAPEVPHCRAKPQADVRAGRGLSEPRGFLRIELSQNRLENRALSISARRAAHHRPGGVNRHCFWAHDREFCDK